MAFSGPRGGPFSPSLFEYRVSSTAGAVSYSIRTPSWLTASSTFGTTDTRGITISLTVNANASRLSPGEYGPAVAFTNVSNGQGSAIRPAKLIIQSCRLLVRQLKSCLVVEGACRTTAEDTCWTTAEDTCWTTAPAACWRSDSAHGPRLIRQEHCIRLADRKCGRAAKLGRGRY